MDAIEINLAGCCIGDKRSGKVKERVRPEVLHLCDRNQGTEEIYDTRRHWEGQAGR